MQKLNRPILTLHPERIDVSSAWIGHLPFAFWIIDAVRPDSLVELGTHGGVSYCAFCQAINHLELDTKAHAIDTWDGDSHTGDYPSETYVELKEYHDQRYSSFSDLVRTTFDNAAEKFANGSIDLLHIDGLHTLDAVRHDFETWLPKLTKQAVVLFHDINVYERDFGVQEFWREVSEDYPSFAFEHGHGLGVLAVGKDQSKAVQWLTGLSPAQSRTVREKFSDLARPLHYQAKLAAEVVGLREELERVDAKRHEAEQLHHQSDAVRVELERDVLSLGENSAQLEDNLAAQKEQTALLEEALQNAKSQFADAQEHLNEQLADVQQRLAHTEKYASDNEQLALKLTSDIGQMKASSSWRLSAPVRLVGGWITGGVGAIRNGLSGPSTAGTIVRTLGSKGGLRRGVAGIRERGFGGSLRRIRNQVATARSLEQKLALGDTYQDWITRYDALTDSDLDAMRSHCATFEYQPLLSIVLPVYNTTPDFLRACLDSVLVQTYSNWELCIADDLSPESAPRHIIEEYARKDARVRFTFRTEQGGIANCTNSALTLAEGDFIVLLDHDDLLAPHALYMVAYELNQNAQLDLIFSDEDKIDDQGARFDPHFKSDFNYELLLGQNCISHLGVYRRSLVVELGGLREGFDGSQDHDLALRVVERSSPKRIAHIPHVLYHWRVFGESGSFSTDNLDQAVAAGVNAVQDHLGEASGASVEPAGVGGYLRVRWPLPEVVPEVTVIVPTRDNAELLGKCIDGLMNNTGYSNMKVLVVDNGSRDEATLKLLEEIDSEADIRVLEYDEPFNYSAINNYAVEHVGSDYLCLLNDDIQMIEPDWLDEMMSLAVRQDIGAVGARLLYADSTVQHGGVVLGVMGVANHLHKHLDVTNPGNFGRLQLCQELSASTAACLVVKRSRYRQVGGLDEENLTVAFNDIDFCLRLREAGYRNLWTPHATLFHMESASRGSDMDADKFKRFEKEVNYMQQRWGALLQSDPFYNPNLSLSDEQMSLAEPPRSTRPWLSA